MSLFDKDIVARDIQVRDFFYFAEDFDYHTTPRLENCMNVGKIDDNLNDDEKKLSMSYNHI